MVLARATGTDSEAGWAAVPVQTHDGGVVTARGRAARERVRLQATAMFEQQLLSAYGLMCRSAYEVICR